MEKIKKYINSEYLKEHLNVVILGILILIFLVATLIYFLISRNVSKIEKDKIINDTTPYINYLEDIENSKSKDIDKYIIYTLDYFTYEKGQNSLKTEEISNFINDTFNKKLQLKPLYKIKKISAVSQGEKPITTDEYLAKKGKH